MGFSAPNASGSANAALIQMAAQAFDGRKATRALLYNPDAIAFHLYAHYTDFFLPVLKNTTLAMPMQSVMPSVTPVCFASMYTGAMPDVHGIQAYVKPVLTTDTLFDAAIRAGLKPAIVSTAGDSISKIFLDRPMDYFIFDTVDEVNAKAEALIAEDAYDILVIYNGNYDSTMHRYAPESKEALAALRANAAQFDKFCALTRQHWAAHDTLIAFAPDHGCHPIDGGLGSHGLDMPEDMLITHFYGAQPKN